jgi:hypothetical protein
MTPRYLEIRDAELAHAGDLGATTTLAVPPGRARLEAQRAFDAARYDSLRILSTELKRILRDGGEVKVRLSRTRVLDGASLARLFKLV